jgi:tryptophan-rich sensory protein
VIILAIIIWVGLLGAGGAFLTRLGPWYYGLRMPAWNPPDWLFGPVWTAIFLLAAVAWWRARAAAGVGSSARGAIALAFAANGILNLGWSYLFFWRQRPDWALTEVWLLVVSILALIGVTVRVDALAGWLVAPYLGWVLFASRLNAAVVRLNAPFPGT